MKKVIIGILILALLVLPLTGCGGAPAKPSQTSAERAYAETTGNWAGELGEAFEEISELLESPQYGSTDWGIKVAAQILIIRTAYDEVKEMSSPASMAHIHHKWVQALEHFNTFTVLLARGIDELDPDLIGEATAEVVTGTQLIGEATDLMVEFNEAHK